MIDEFNKLPAEFPKLPSETSYRKAEENGYKRNKKKTSSVDLAGSNGKKSSLIKMLLGATLAVNVAGITVMAEPEPEIISKVYSFETGGTAQITGSTIELTELEEQSIGGIWSLEPIKLDGEDLTIEFDVLLSSSKDEATGVASDGLSVAFSETGESTDLEPGGNLGYKGDFGVEFDLFCNPIEETPGGIDYPNDHIAVIGKNTWTHYAVSSQLELDDGQWKKVKLVYQQDGMLTVYMDEKNMVAYKVDLQDKYYDSGLFIAITAATGSGTCYQAIRNVMINDSVIDLKMGNHITYEKPVTYEEVMEEEPVVVLKTISIPCSKCSGHGIICPGSVAADDPEGCHGNVIVACKACNQTGKKSDGTPCSWCHGTLKHVCPSFEEHISCEACGGSGYISCIAQTENSVTEFYDFEGNEKKLEQPLMIGCDECFGTGILCQGDSLHPEGCHGTTVHKCFDCSGKGVNADGTNCKNCGGSGWDICKVSDKHTVCAKCDGKGLIDFVPDL